MTVFHSISALFVLLILLLLGAEVDAFIGYGIEMVRTIFHAGNLSERYTLYQNAHVHELPVGNS